MKGYIMIKYEVCIWRDGDSNNMMVDGTWFSDHNPSKAEKDEKYFSGLNKS